MRDQRPWSGTAPPGAVYYFSPDRKGEHPREHLKNSAGVLQADAYTGFKALYETRADGSTQFREAACWAHLRRDFHDIWTATKSEIAKEALDRIGKFYDIEREIKGLRCTSSVKAPAPAQQVEFIGRAPGKCSRVATNDAGSSNPRTLPGVPFRLQTDFGVLYLCGCDRGIGCLRV